MQPGDNIIIAGETGRGKTTLAMQLARNAAKRAPVLFCSGEMSQRKLGNREVARLTGHTIPEISLGRYSEETKNQILSQAVGLLAESNIHYHYGKLTVSKIRQLAKQMQVQNGLGIVFVDYLQIVKDERRGRGDYEKVSNISEDLQELAQELDVPIVSGCQLARPNGMLGEKLPTLGRLKGSGDIENDADIVLAIHRDKKKDSQGNESQFQLEDNGKLIVLKFRQGGATGACEINWDWRKQEYSEVNV
jgi:replicative DNA helicase